MDPTADCVTEHVTTDGNRKVEVDMVEVDISQPEKDQEINADLNMDADEKTAEDAEKESTGHDSDESDDEPVVSTPAKRLNLRKRLQDLKKNVKTLEKAILEDYDSYDSDSDRSEAGPELQARRSTPVYNLMTLDAYQQRDEKQDFSLQKKHFTLDAVMTAGWTPSSMSTTTSAETESVKTPAKLVRFIQINSEALCAVLHKHARFTQSSNDPPSVPNIMLAPFKPLCFYEEKLRQRLAELRAKYEGMTWEKMDLAVEQANEDEKDSSQIENGKLSVETSSSLPITIETSNLPPGSPQIRTPLRSHTIADNFLAQAEVEWPSLKYRVSWGGTEVQLHFSDVEHLTWSEVPNQPAVAAYVLNLSKIDSLERTVDTSSVVALKIRYNRTWADDFIFISDTAHEDMERFSDVLISLARRCKLARLQPKQDSADSAADPKKPNADVEVSQSALDAATMQMASDEKVLEEISLDSNDAIRKLGRKLLKKVMWKPVEVKLDEDDLDGRSLLDFGEDSFKAFEDLQCLMKFYDEFIKPSWDPVRAKSTKNIAFADLGMFFRPGDHIHVPEDDHKVWRVLQVTGARPKLDHLLSEDFNFTGDATTDSQKRSKQGDAPTVTKEVRPNRSAESENWSTLALDCYYIDYDGSVLGAVHRQFVIKYFAGRRDVKSLKAYPIEWLKQMKLADSDLKLLRHVERNGDRFDRLCLRKKSDRDILYYYDGRTNVRSPSGRSLTRGDDDDSSSIARLVRSEDVSSHVVIDFDKTFQYNPRWEPSFRKPSLWSKEESEGTTQNYRGYRREIETKCSAWEVDFEASELDEWVKEDSWAQPDAEERSNKRELLLGNDWELLPDKVFGFVLRSRSWACLNIHEDQLTEVKEETTPWAELQIPDEHRITLQSLVKRHFDTKTATLDTKRSSDFDLIQGKGRGLIVLLHGAPGLGKTSTAESIAALYKKPLLPITCGNLGLDALSVERALNENFELAQTWDCIVLLDEADVFLAQRENSDLARNALVSVFLRTLEYYSGILFLTTNRIGTFDEAFRSRIHSALFYKDLDRESTREVWKTNLNRLLKQKEHLKQQFTISEPDIIVEYAVKIWDIYKIYQRAPWNGREIRNAFQTAVALAEFKASTPSGKEASSVRETPSVKEVSSDREAPSSKGVSSDKEASRDKDVSNSREANTPTLTWENFQSVILASQDFERYLIDTRGGETDYDRAGRKHLRFSSADVTRRAQQQQVEAFTQALRAVNPHTIVTYPLPFSNTNGYSSAPGPGSFDRKMTINDMISSNTPPPAAAFMNGGYQQFQNQNHSLQNQSNMQPLQQQHQGQYGMQGGTLPSMSQFMTGANNSAQGYSSAGQVQTQGYPQQQQRHQQQQQQQQYNQPQFQQDSYQPFHQYNNLNQQQGPTSQLGNSPMQNHYSGASPPPVFNQSGFAEPGRAPSVTPSPAPL